MRNATYLAGAALVLALAPASAFADGQPVVVTTDQPPVAGQPAVDGAARGPVVIVVQGGGGATDAYPPKPAVGALSEGEVFAYLEQVRSRIDAIKVKIKETRAADYDDTALQEELRAANDYYKAERTRLTTTDGGMIAGGATLTAIGGVGLVAAVFCGLAYGLSNSFGGSGDDGLGTAALVTLGVGIAGLGVGIPLLAIGLRRVPRDGSAVAAVPMMFVGVSQRPASANLGAFALPTGEDVIDTRAGLRLAIPF